MSTKCTSPLESLSSFAIAFAAGALALSLINAWGDWKESQGSRAVNEEPFTEPKQED